MSSRVAFKIEKVADHYEAVSRALDKLTSNAALVGVPEEKAPRDNAGSINNATLAYIHENGSDRAHIPPWPFLKTGVERARADINARLGEAAKAATDGDEGGVTRGLNKTGQVAVNSIRKVFTDNSWVPLKEATLRAKGAKLKKVKNPETGEMEEKWKGKTRPLIDTAQLRKSITYVIEET